MAKTSLGMEENLEALLTYVLGWITGIIFLLLEKNSKFVRFHAMQSTITFLGFTIVMFILLFIPLIGWALNLLLAILGVIVWIVCIVKAYQGEKYKLPFIGDIAEKRA